MPSAAVIRAFWCELLWEAKGFDSPEEFMEEGICFACGVYSKGLERAHIEARCIGGSDKCDNLHMLCAVCHKASERLEGVKYWEWFFERSMMDMALEALVRSGCGINLWSAFRSK